MAKLKQAPAAGFRLVYDLKACADPLTRLGIHGLYRLLHFAGLPKFAHLYPRLKQSATLKWSLDETSITIDAATPEDLGVIVGSMFSSMPHGVVILPGYPSVPNIDVRFYLTALTHTAITGALFKSGKSGRTRSFESPLEIKDGKVHPDDAAGLSLSDGKVKAEDLVCKLKGTDPNSLIRQVTGCTNSGGKSIERKVTPHCPDAKLGKSVLFASLEEALPNALVNNGYNLQRPVKLAGVHHPLCATWENKSIEMPFPNAFAVTFSALAYVYTSCSDGFLGVGLDLPTFKEADKFHRYHILGFEKSIKEGFLYHVHGNADVAAFTLLTHLECPANRIYPVVASNGDGKDATVSAWDFYYRTGPGYGLYAKFQQALDGGMEYEDVKRTLRVLRLVPLAVKGSPKDNKFRSVYDQVLQNLNYGMAWHHDLSQVAFLSRTLAKDKTKQIEGLLPLEGQALTLLVQTMQSDKEKKILEAANRLLGAVANQYDHYQDKYDRAREFMVKSHLAKAVGKTSLLDALWRVMIFGEFIMPTDTLTLITEEAERNPREVKNLLILGACTYTPKATQDSKQSQTTASANP